MRSTKGRIIGRGLLAASLAVIGLSVATGTAVAAPEPATVTVETLWTGTKVATFLAGRDTVNHVTVRPVSGGVEIEDSTGTVQAPAGGGCTLLDAHTAVCTPVQLTSVVLGDLDDTAENLAPLSLHAFGEAGHDTLVGGKDRDFLAGGDGDDTMEGRESADQFYGDAGRDVLTGGPGEDVFWPGIGTGDVVDGGPGRYDTVNYMGSPGGVTVRLDDVANDGMPGEADDIRATIEIIGGSDFADRLVGSAEENDIHGFGGDDILEGLANNDSFNGGGGADTVDYSHSPSSVRVDMDGRADDGAEGEGDRVGSDVENIIGSAFPDGLTGYSTNSRLEGGGGEDTLYGGDGDDTLLGGPGNDLLVPEHGRDSVDGGAGVDIASYHAAFGAVTISLNDVADDGRPGEQDNVRSTVERIIGSPHGDHLIGSDANNEIYGRNGDDTIEGLAGDDQLYAEGGAGQRIYGGAGQDHCSGAGVVVRDSCER